MKILNFIKEKSYLYKTISRITTLYTNKGDYDKEFDFKLFKKRVLSKIYESCIIGILFTFIAFLFNSEINAEKITEDNSLAKIISKYNPFESLNLKILRDGQEIYLNIILGEWEE